MTRSDPWAIVVNCTPTSKDRKAKQKDNYIVKMKCVLKFSLLKQDKMNKENEEQVA